MLNSAQLQKHWTATVLSGSQVTTIFAWWARTLYYYLEDLSLESEPYELAQLNWS